MRTSFEVFPMLLEYAWNRNIKPLKFAMTSMMANQIRKELREDFNYIECADEYQLAPVGDWLPENDHSYWGFVLGYPVAIVDYPGHFIMVHTNEGEYLWNGREITRFLIIDGQLVETHA